MTSPADRSTGRPAKSSHFRQSGVPALAGQTQNQALENRRNAPDIRLLTATDINFPAVESAGGSENHPASIG